MKGLRHGGARLPLDVHQEGQLQVGRPSNKSTINDDTNKLNISTYKKEPFGDHPLNLERYRED